MAVSKTTRHPGRRNRSNFSPNKRILIFPRTWSVKLQISKFRTSSPWGAARTKGRPLRSRRASTKKTSTSRTPPKSAAAYPSRVPLPSSPTPKRDPIRPALEEAKVVAIGRVTKTHPIRITKNKIRKIPRALVEESNQIIRLITKVRNQYPSFGFMSELKFRRCKLCPRLRHYFRAFLHTSKDTLRLSRTTTSSPKWNSKIWACRSFWPTRIASG